MPSRVTPSKIQQDAYEWRIAHPTINNDRPIVALVVGSGENIDSETLAEIKETFPETEYSICFTTSRRTPKSKKELLQATFPSAEIGIMWEDNLGPDQNPYFALLGLAKTILVTSDSLSMIGDAVKSGKEVAVVGLQLHSVFWDAKLGEFRSRSTAVVFEAGLVELFQAGQTAYPQNPTCYWEDVGFMVAFLADRKFDGRPCTDTSFIPYSTYAIKPSVPTMGLLTAACG